MTYSNFIRAVFTVIIIFTSSMPLVAQDLIAKQAPIDRKMKAVDTLALKDLIFREQAVTPAAELYEEWDNIYAHKATVLPDSFLVDMRNFCMPTPSRVVTSNYGSRWGRQHKGIDIKGIVRALFVNVASGGISEGASTITQQLTICYTS